MPAYQYIYVGKPMRLPRLILTPDDYRLPYLGEECARSDSRFPGIGT
jgi:hypothetical protein